MHNQEEHELVKKKKKLCAEAEQNPLCKENVSLGFL